MTLTPAAGADPSPAWFAVLHGPQLVADVTPDHAVVPYPPTGSETAPTWMLRCEDTTDNWCKTAGPADRDADDDGYVDRGDCDDNDSDVYWPRNSENPPDTGIYDKDDNCDGWTKDPP